jgi:hypothetical protein
VSYWVLREKRAGGYYLISGAVDDTVWGPHRHEATLREANVHTFDGDPVSQAGITSDTSGTEGEKK